MKDMAEKKKKDPFSLYVRNGVYYARLWDENEKTYTIARSTKTTNRDEARDIANEMIRAGQLKKKTDDPIFADEILSYWETRTGVDPRYCREMASKVKKLIKPSRLLKGIRMSTVNQYHINRLLEDMQKNGASPYVLNQVKRMIIKFLNHGLSLGYIPRDFTKQILKIDKIKVQRGFLEPCEITKLEALPWPDLRIKAAVLLGCIASMRKGEIRAVRWRDIDFDRDIINIQSNFVGYRDEAGNPLFKEPKRGSSRRHPYLRLSPVLKETLRQLYLETPFRAPGDLCLVTVSPNYDPYAPIHEHTLREGLIKMLEAIGISIEEQKRRKIVFHSLRHSAVTFFAANADPKASMAVAGHDTPGAHAIYTHTLQSQIDNAFSRARAYLDQYRDNMEDGTKH